MQEILPPRYESPGPITYFLLLGPLETGNIIWFNTFKYLKHYLRQNTFIDIDVRLGFCFNITVKFLFIINSELPLQGPSTSVAHGHP